MRSITRITVLLAMLAMLPFAARADRPDAKTDEGVSRTLNTFFDAWNRHDAKSMASAWVEDGTLINPMGRVAHGRAEIERLLTEEQAGVFRSSTARMSSITVTRRMGPELAFCDGDMTVDGGMAPDGSALPTMSIHLAVLMERKAGRWSVLEARPYSFLPAPAPADSSR